MALSRLDSAEGRAPFNRELTPAYGVFYTGWTIWPPSALRRLRAGGKVGKRG
jgi:hypothetical protein